MPKQPIVVSYLRFSSKRQAKGNSERRQTDYLEDEAAIRRLEEQFCRSKGLTLDTRMRFADRGVSGHYGKHRSKERIGEGGLTDLLAYVQAGDIPPGSFLLVERLNRLTRESPLDALALIIVLLKAGLRIVTLHNGQVFDADADPMELTTKLMVGMVEVGQGHISSAEKSDWTRDNWRARREDARQGAVMTTLVPAWCNVVGRTKVGDKVIGGRIVLDKRKAAVVRRIYRMAIDGYGIPTIVKALNTEGVPTLSGRSGHWARSTIGAILQHRTALGEYRPRKRAGGKVPPGDPIPDYYPAVVTEDEYRAARAAIDQRYKRGRGRTGRVVNVFAGLLTDARTGGALHVSRLSTGRYVVPHLATNGVGEWHSFDAAAFERSVLGGLREIDPASVLGRDTAGERVLACQGRVDELKGEIAEWMGAKGNRDIKAVVDKIAGLEAELVEAEKQLAAARYTAANPLTAAWGDVRSLADALDSEDGRTRLRTALRRVVERIYCLFCRRGRGSIAAVQVYFAGSDRHRDYLVTYHPLWKGRSREGIIERPASLSVASFADAGLAAADLDLRDPKQAAALAADLEADDKRKAAEETPKTARRRRAGR